MTILSQNRIFGPLLTPVSENMQVVANYILKDRDSDIDESDNAIDVDSFNATSQTIEQQGVKTIISD